MVLDENQRPNPLTMRVEESDKLLSKFLEHFSITCQEQSGFWIFCGISMWLSFIRSYLCQSLQNRPESIFSWRFRCWLRISPNFNAFFRLEKRFECSAWRFFVLLLLIVRFSDDDIVVINAQDIAWSCNFQCIFWWRMKIRGPEASKWDFDDARRRKPLVLRRYSAHPSTIERSWIPPYSHGRMSQEGHIENQRGI